MDRQRPGLKSWQSTIGPSTCASTTSRLRLSTVIDRSPTLDAAAACHASSESVPQVRAANVILSGCSHSGRREDSDRSPRRNTSRRGRSSKTRGSCSRRRKWFPPAWEVQKGPRRQVLLHGAPPRSWPRARRSRHPSWKLLNAFRQRRSGRTAYRAVTQADHGASGRAASSEQRLSQQYVTCVYFVQLRIAMTIMFFRFEEDAEDPEREQDRGDRRDSVRARWSFHPTPPRQHPAGPAPSPPCACAIAIGVRAFCTLMFWRLTLALWRSVSTMAPIIATSSTMPASWK